MALAFLGALACGAGAAKADIIEIEGTTAGSALIHNGTGQDLGLTVLHVSFAPNTFGPQSSDVPLNLGTFSLAPCFSCNESYSPYDFMLNLAFSTPAGTVVSQAKGDVGGKLRVVSGSVTRNTVEIGFGKTPLLFNFQNQAGHGQFSLTLRDIPRVEYGGTATLTGIVSNAQFTPVPEPGSITLLGTVLVGLACVIRKHRQGRS